MEYELLCDRLSNILTPTEVEELVEAFEAIIKYRNGYGHIAVVIERKHVIQIGITSTVKPGVS